MFKGKDRPRLLPEEQRRRSRLKLNTSEIETFDSMDLKLPNIDRSMKKPIRIHEDQETIHSRCTMTGRLQLGDESESG